jgi:hypothetical protein
MMQSRLTRETLGHRPSRRLRLPRDAAAIMVPHPNGALTADQIFPLFSAARDWRPAPDPRTPMAFATTPGWVFKSNLAWRYADAARAIAVASRMIDACARLGIWHPAKTWFVLNDRRRFVAVSATPRLVLPSDAGVRRLYGGRQQLRQISHAAERGWRLDVRPCNFGFDAHDWRLYYLDDEVRPVRR